MQYCSIADLASIISHIHNWVLFLLWLHLFILSFDLLQHVGHLPTWGVPLSVSYHFAFSYCSWGSQGKNKEVVCHSLLQWTTFCQTSPLIPVHLGWPHRARLSFIELDKAVVCMIRLTSFLWLWFVCLPSDASRNTYHLTWVCLTLDLVYIFTAAPAKCSCCSLPWTRGISSQPPLLTLNMEQLLSDVSVSLYNPFQHQLLVQEGLFFFISKFYDVLLGGKEKV